MPLTDSQWAAEAADIFARLAAGTITEAQAAAELGVATADWPTRSLSNAGLAEQLSRFKARVNGLILTDGPPADDLGGINAIAIDLTAKVFYGPKTSEGWGTGFSMIGGVVSFRANGTHLQYQVGAEGWQNITPLSAIQGPAGTIVSATIESLDPDEDPEIELGGTASARTMHFKLPTAIAPDTVDAFMALGPVVARGDLYGLDTIPSTLGFALSGSERAFAAGFYRDGPVVEAGFPELDGDTFTRSSGGTARTEAGELVIFAPGVPRITNIGLLSEGGAVNALPQGERPDDTRHWNHTGATFVGRVWQGDGYLFSGGPAAPGMATAMLVVGSAGATSLNVGIVAQPSNERHDVIVNPATGAVISADAGATPFIVPVAGGNIVHISAVLPSGTTAAALILAGANGPLFPLQAQINAGGPTSYIPTAPAATNLIEDSDMVLNADAGFVLTGSAIQTVVAGAGPQNQTMVRRIEALEAVSIRLESSYVLGAPGSLYGGSLYIRTRDAASRVVTIEINDAVSDTSNATGGWSRLGVVGSNAIQPYRWIDLTLAPGDYEIAGQQIELGPIITPLIHTAGSAVTRPALDPVRTADVATAGIGIGASGTLVVEIIAPALTGGVRAVIGDPGGTAVPLYVNADAGYLCSWNGSLTLINYEPLTPGEKYRVAITWDAARRAICRTASAVAADGGAILQQASTRIGCWGTGSQLESSIAIVASLPFAVDNTTLQALTVIP